MFEFGYSPNHNQQSQLKQQADSFNIVRRDFLASLDIIKPYLKRLKKKVNWVIKPFLEFNFLKLLLTGRAFKGPTYSVKKYLGPSMV